MAAAAAFFAGAQGGVFGDGWPPAVSQNKPPFYRCPRYLFPDRTQRKQYLEGSRRRIEATIFIITDVTFNLWNQLLLISSLFIVVLILHKKNMELATLELTAKLLGDYSIIGDFKAKVEHIEHTNLTKYVECFRNRNEKVTLVFEHFPPITSTLNSFSNGHHNNSHYGNQKQNNQLPPFVEIARQLLDALDYLHNQLNCTHGLINVDCLAWSEQDQTLKLSHWPINLLSDRGSALGTATILPRNSISFIAPEQIKTPTKQATQKSDLWSAGLTLLKLIKSDSCKLPENPCRLAFCDNAESLLNLIEGWLDDNIITNSSMWNQFFKSILQPDPEKRADLGELYLILRQERPFCIKEPLLVPLDPDQSESQQEKVSKLTISEIYHLWRLSVGRNFESERKQDDCPPIFRIPHFIATEKQMNTISDQKLKNHILIDLTCLKVISLEKFKNDIDNLDQKIFYPLTMTDEEALLLSHESRTSTMTSDSNSNSISISDNQECNNNLKNGNSSRKLSGPITFADLDNLSIKSTIQTEINKSSKILPIVIKEADFAYQCERIVLFKRLLFGCPFLKDQLKREASIDIPPYYRAQIWAILLDVPANKSRRLYETIDKTTPLATDRQISVDIPRCHQYNELMASPQGHQKLARILKSWLNHNSSEYVYWQGLDSLAAPFLLLNFSNEPLAFACFNAFVDKYLRGFFKKDNQIIVQQYLGMFSELLSYHDSALAAHLDKLGFLPNLYAIPWFLTMFTHVLPLHKVLHVWDCLLLHDERFPLCIGLAILSQLRQELMDFSFNDCIVAFSDLPEIDIERCIREASHFYNSTPDKLIDMSDMREYQEQW